MRAILRKQFGGPDMLEIREIPEPELRAGHAVIQVKAFGIKHAEMHMRKGEWAEIADVSGIECVGVVKSCPGGEFAVGTKVAALMGGLGRTINGSYAEYTRAPVANVAAIPETEELAVLAAVQRPISPACITVPVDRPLWKDRPTWFLVAEQDRMIVHENQRFMAQRMKARNARIPSISRRS